MPKKCLSILLLVVLTMQIFQRTFIVLDYYINPAAFAKNCENKARPKLLCNGKCQMMKKLQAEEKQEQQNPDHKLSVSNEVITHAPQFYLPAPVLYLITIRNYPSHHSGELIDRSASIFHPPAIV